MSVFPECATCGRPITYLAGEWRHHGPATSSLELTADYREGEWIPVTVRYPQSR